MEPYITFEGCRIACSAIEYIPSPVQSGAGFAVEFHLKSGKMLEVMFATKEEAEDGIKELDELFMERYSDYRNGLVECLSIDLKGHLYDVIAEIKEAWTGETPP
jgi:hypothetical protein